MTLSLFDPDAYDADADDGSPDPLDEVLATYPDLARGWTDEEFELVCHLLREADQGEDYTGPPLAREATDWPPGTLGKINVMRDRLPDAQPCRAGDATWDDTEYDGVIQRDRNGAAQRLGIRKRKVA